MNYSKDSQFHVIAKTVGSECNLECSYCYYLDKRSRISRGGNFLIPDDTLENFIHQYINGQGHKEIRFSWQGGEPTLAGIPFFEKVIALQKKHRPPGKNVYNDFQTNGVLLDDGWCAFLHENNFLVGLSVDGPRQLHDKYRLDKKGGSTFDKIVNAAKLLKNHKVEYNTLTVVNRVNAGHPLDVYRFLRDEVDSTYMQFIACVEPEDFKTAAPHGGNSTVTGWSVAALDYGDFLCGIFDEWYGSDIGRVFVVNFEAALNLWMGKRSSVCYFSETCGKSLAMENDGSLYSCDHYVYPEHKLGNIDQKSLPEMAFSRRQMDFGLSKTSSLPSCCRACKYLFACNGGCPKNRLIFTPEGQSGLNYLCRGLKRYFSHIEPYMDSFSERIKKSQTVSRDGC
ncbi:MAG: anaerobic sulfatase maturase [Candidatus Omnitrophota bacterium]